MVAPSYVAAIHRIFDIRTAEAEAEGKVIIDFPSMWLTFLWHRSSVPARRWRNSGG